uniref:ATP-grasp domain-containing protein n=1 Tax=Chromera velia CCMP2878 TaxID=1169474 RepID=A0A0G4HZ85_9ALVE|mmetsp:Transcript_10189/g.19756  ORF Transcript_10189/g.19756 Transcript_10189/m.19756 type:complete len:399 (-) Transcript_10189:633-1829(-)|eukprot:Cvel_9646.t1-p1 / transcript=Cvel_9646.t1 / gene=Cvel_9646 / organism=Chromera_velia_CCMP2878 / gene_product=D-alanine--D-alanine ligase, putative / transcript_product=D-alanine--D-alanine ligase, putative / location=Cvel_scaffold561:29336-30529(-) / protein_length=398 / sequence_SO=supercontig / SO=protein_coding / is_pseudo=false
MCNQKKTRVLHVLGSAVSEYYAGLSTHYAQMCVEGARDEETTANFEFLFAVVRPSAQEGQGAVWSFPADLSEESLEKAERVSHSAAVFTITQMKPDCCLPHMFCYPGMTTFRALMELLNIPIVGCSAQTMGLCTNKAQTKAVVAAAGVPIPPGELLRHGDRPPSLSPPFVLKPCCEDNSMGVSVVKSSDPAAIDAALEEAFKFDDEVVCEKFIPPGRELRIAVLEDDDGVPSKVLPLFEYFVDKENPIRTSADKVTTKEGSSGKVTGLASGNRKCPADVDSVLLSKLTDAAIKSHRALGCRDYSLFDFRVDPEGNIFFLEACSYCSFAPKSVVVTMASAAEDESIAHPQLLHSMLRRAALRGMPSQPTALEGEKSGEVKQQLGMRQQMKRPSVKSVAA